MRGLGVFLVPTFVPFTPWTPLEGYEDLLTHNNEDLLTHNNKDGGRWNTSRPSNSPPGALIPTGLCLPQVLARHNAAIAPFGQEALSYPGGKSGSQGGPAPARPRSHDGALGQVRWVAHGDL
jgi:hypothetical protein